MLDFKPRWSVESGVRQVIEAFQAGKIKDYNKAKYSNVKSLTEESSTLNGEFYANRWAYELIRKVS
jgi:hypothetical protein